MVLREREILFNILKQYGTLVLHIIRQDGKEIFHLADFYPAGNKNDVKFFKNVDQKTFLKNIKNQNLFNFPEIKNTPKNY
jgi:hypothetical protein